jgi:hypothetical protein
MMQRTSRLLHCRDARLNCGDGSDLSVKAQVCSEIKTAERFGLIRWARLLSSAPGVAPRMLHSLQAISGILEEYI